jgi:hypothetical protein
MHGALHLPMVKSLIWLSENIKANAHIRLDYTSPWSRLSGFRVNHEYNRSIPFLDNGSNVTCAVVYKTLSTSGPVFDIIVQRGNDRKDPQQFTDVTVNLEQCIGATLVAHLGDRRVASRVVTYEDAITVFCDVMFPSYLFFVYLVNLLT